MMLMYVILVIAVLLFAGLVLGVVRTLQADRRSARKRAEAAVRLEAVAAQAAREHQERTAAAEVSGALTAVLPAIQPDHAPRKVA